MNRSTVNIVAVAAVCTLTLAGCASMQSGDGWQTLIDGGRGMENFITMGDANWHSESDAIVADKSASNQDTNYLATKATFKDFHIRAEFWVSDDANSGLYVRCSDVRPMTARTCHEANIFDQRPDPTWATGAISGLVKAPVPVPRTGGKWNTMEVIAKGTHMTVMLNGVKTADTDQARDMRGVIGLQYASGIVRFRSLQVKAL